MYSECELHLFAAFGVRHLSTDLTPSQMYRTLIDKAFLENMTGEHVEALRRGANAFYSSTYNRKTIEFDTLITFSF